MDKYVNKNYLIKFNSNLPKPNFHKKYMKQKKQSKKNSKTKITKIKQEFSAQL